jgi:hypothetical protein
MLHAYVSENVNPAMQTGSLLLRNTQIMMSYYEITKVPSASLGSQSQKNTMKERVSV